MNTKLHAVTDTNGRPIRFFMTAGQVSDYTGARALVNTLPAADWLLGDRGYDADWFREALIDKEKNALHSRTEVTRRTRQIRQAPLHEAQPDRSHVRAIEGLETRSHALRPKPQSVPLSDRSRRNSDFLVLAPTLLTPRRSCNSTCAFSRVSVRCLHARAPAPCLCKKIQIPVAFSGYPS